MRDADRLDSHSGLCLTLHSLGGLMAPGSGLAEEEVFLPFRKQWRPYCHECAQGHESKYGYTRRPLTGHSCSRCALAGERSSEQSRRTDNGGSE
jgi:hypothetical protein